MTHPVVLSILSAMLILYPLQTHIYYKAMKALPLSTFGMLSGITPLSAMIFSYLFIGGHLRVFGIIGIFLTVGAIGVLSYKNQSKEIPLSTLLTAISAYSVFGLVNVLDKIALAHSIPMTYTMMNQSVAAIAIFLYTYFILGDAKFGFLRANLPQITLMGLAISVSWLSLSYALTLSPNA